MDNLAVSDMALLESTVAAADAATPAVVDAGGEPDADIDVNQTIDQAIKDEGGEAKVEPPVDGQPKVDEPVVDPAKVVEPPKVDSEIDLTADDLTIKGLNAKLASSPIRTFTGLR